MARRGVVMRGFVVSVDMAALTGTFTTFSSRQPVIDGAGLKGA